MTEFRKFSRNKLWLASGTYRLYKKQRPIRLKNLIKSIAIDDIRVKDVSFSYDADGFCFSILESSDSKKYLVFELIVPANNYTEANSKVATFLSTVNKLSESPQLKPDQLSNLTLWRFQ